MAAIPSSAKSKNVREGYLHDVSTDLATIPAHLHRVVRTRLVRTSLDSIRPGELTSLHHEILRLLDIGGKTNPAEIGRRLLIAKAQITKLVNKLVEAGLVERHTDPLDKRVYNVILTDTGKKFTRKQRDNFVNAIDSLTCRFSDDELQELSASLRKIHEMLFKME